MEGPPIKKPRIEDAGAELKAAIRRQSLCCMKELRESMKGIMNACKGTVLEQFLDMSESVQDLLQELDDINEGMDDYFYSVFQTVTAIFARFDSDGNGVLDGAEYTACVNAMVLHMKSEFERELRKGIDRIKLEDGSHDELFQSMMRRKFKEEDIKRLVIGMVDPDGDGKITKAEALAGFKKVVDEIEEDSVEKQNHVVQLCSVVKSALKFDPATSPTELFETLDDLEEDMVGYGQAILDMTAKIFHRFDRGGSGVIQGSEYEECISAITAYLKSEIGRKLRRDIETRYVGRLLVTNADTDSEELFRTMMQRKFNEQVVKEMVARIVDPDGDGRIVLCEAVVGFRQVVRQFY